MGCMPRTNSSSSYYSINSSIERYRASFCANRPSTASAQRWLVLYERTGRNAETNKDPSLASMSDAEQCGYWYTTGGAILTVRHLEQASNLLLHGTEYSEGSEVLEVCLISPPESQLFVSSMLSILSLLDLRAEKDLARRKDHKGHRVDWPGV